VGKTQEKKMIPEKKGNSPFRGKKKKNGRFSRKFIGHEGRRQRKGGRVAFLERGEKRFPGGTLFPDTKKEPKRNPFQKRGLTFQREIKFDTGR